MIVVSACLAGINCKYDGKNNINNDIVKLVREGKAILICPEQMGGMSTPRDPSEIVKENNKVKILSNNGKDVTKFFSSGSKEALKTALLVNAKIAILKANSPSCGCGKIYDGTFSSNLKKGNGITAELFLQNGIKVYNEYNWRDKIEEIR